MIYAQLPDATDPYVPHLVMLDVTYVGGMVCLEIVDREEDNATTRTKKRDGASISVDVCALLGVLKGMIQADNNHRVRGERGDLDKNFYNGYASPLTSENQPRSTTPEDARSD